MLVRRAVLQNSASFRAGGLKRGENHIGIALATSVGQAVGSAGNSFSALRATNDNFHTLGNLDSPAQLLWVLWMRSLILCSANMAPLPRCSLSNQLSRSSFHCPCEASRYLSNLCAHRP